MDKNKIITSTKDTTKMCDAFCDYFIDHPRIAHGSIPVGTSHQLDHIEVKERSMYFRNTTKTDIIESTMYLNKEGSINDVSRKFLVMCKHYVSIYLKELFNFSITSDVYPNVFFNCSVYTHSYEKLTL